MIKQILNFILIFTLFASVASADYQHMILDIAPGSGNPCVNPAANLASISGLTSTTNSTQIIAAANSAKIYICSLTIIGVSGTSPTFSLVQGSGSNCSNFQTNLIQGFQTSANQLYQFAHPVSIGIMGNALCYKNGGNSPVQNYNITYVQQ